MKGQLLKEFISRILVEAEPLEEESEAAKQAKQMGLVSMGFGRWGDPRTRVITHKTINGQLVPVGTTDAPPSRTTKGTTDVAPTGTTDIPSSTDATDTSQYCSSVGCSDTADYFTAQLDKIDKDSNPELYVLLTDLVDALRTADKKKLQEIINKYGCYISKSGKFVCDGNRKSGKIADGSIEFNPDYPSSTFTSNNRALGMSKSRAQKAGPEIQAMLDDLGVEYVNKGKPITSESLKQSRLYADLPAATDKEASVTRVSRGEGRGERVVSVTIDGQTHTKINTPKRTNLIAENKLNEIKRQHPDWSDEQVDEKADRVLAIIAAHNQKIELLAKIVDGGVKMLPPGKEGREFVAERIKDSLKDRDGNPIPELNKIIDEIAAAESPEAVVEGWQRLARLIGENGPYADLFGDGSIPILAEHIETLFQLSLGRQVPVIMDEAFTLVDVVSLSTEPIPANMDLKGVVENIHMIEIAVDTTSVKRNMGAASAVGSRIGTTQFYDSTGEVKRDLNILGASEGYEGTEPTHRRIYSTTEDTIDAVEKEIEDVVRKNMKDVRAYYGFPPEEPPTEDEIIEGLKKGLVPVCGKFQKGEQSSFEKDCPPGSPIGELNRRQMQLYSLAGFAFDAIYNRNTQAQSFSNVNYTLNGRNESNGVTTMARSQFQFNKQMKCRNGQMRDDGIAAKLKNVPVDKMKTNCPPKKTKKK